MIASTLKPKISVYDHGIQNFQYQLVDSPLLRLTFYFYFLPTHTPGNFCLTHKGA